MPKKKSEMTPEEVEEMKLKMARMRELALAKKREMGDATRAQKEVKEQLYEQKRQEVLKKKEEADKVKELIDRGEQPEPQTLQPQTLDVEALRKQIKQEVKQKYKAKFALGAGALHAGQAFANAMPPPYYNPYFGMVMHQQPQPQPAPAPATAPKPAPPADLEDTVKSLAKDELRRKLQQDLLKMVSSSMF